jgi:hypothetical protein
MQLDPANEIERGQQMQSMLPFFIHPVAQALARSKSACANSHQG